ncbi:MAG TPA: hemerythrin domain-containing protein [Mycobacteriales bacterium]|nr:hemerythrin domain-containing protein [Mycobacteriales bacterium]
MEGADNPIEDPVNGLDLLSEQHEQIKHLLARVRENAGTAAAVSDFSELRRLLSVHETAEEIVVRPLTRTEVPNGRGVAGARMNEENEAKVVLARLEKLGADSAEFAAEFPSFESAVLAHAEAEERDELAPLKAMQREGHLSQLGSSIIEAERTAPTHPHPHAKTTAANIVLGPFAAVLDRVRDAIAHRRAS